MGAAIVRAAKPVVEAAAAVMADFWRNVRRSMLFSIGDSLGICWAYLLEETLLLAHLCGRPNAAAG